MSFAKWVSYDTIYRATFNYWEPSMGIEKNGRDYTVYHTQHPNTNVNLVVLEGFRMHRDGHKRCDLFFRTFPGKHSGQYNTLAEAEPFFEELRITASRKYRVTGKELDKAILNAVKQLESS